MFYERPVGWVDTPNGATIGIRRPNSLLVHGKEGYGIVKIDENGYTNSSSVLGNDYTLMLGSSNTQGKEIPSDKKYSEIVNAYLSGNSGKRMVYNIACDANYLCDIIRHFRSTLAVFPDAKCITIEIGNTDFSAGEIEEATQQTELADMRSGKELFAALGKFEKLKILIKEFFPFLSTVKNHLETLRAEQGSSGGSTDSIDNTADEPAYGEAIEKALSLMRSEYSGNILFIYHPSVTILENGSMELEYSETIDLFKNACKKAGIDFCDMGARFLEAYKAEQKVPNGFQNTTFGKGHLNSTGHRLIAEAVIDYLERVYTK